MEEKAKYLCPITNQVMVEPVVDALGNTYDRDAIQKWLQSHTTDPVTNEELPDQKLIPNKAIMAEIAEYKETTIKQALKLLPTIIQ